MGELSYTVGGDSNLVSFKSAARVPITSLKAHFKPKQDLHGYDKPWPAGAGKNLYPGTKLGRIDEETGQEVTGTNTISIEYIPVIAETAYTLSGLDIDTGAVRFFWYASDKAYVSNEAQSAVNGAITITVPSNISYVKMRASSDVIIVDGNTQFEKGSTATSYEPYENICPIEGWTSANIYTTGEELPFISMPGITDSLGVHFVVDNNGIITADGTPTSWSQVMCKKYTVNGDEALYGRIIGNLKNVTNVMPQLYDENGTRVYYSELNDGVFGSNSYLDLKQYPGVKTVIVGIKRLSNGIPVTGQGTFVLTKGSRKPINTIQVTFPVTGKNLFNFNLSTSSLVNMDYHNDIFQNNATDTRSVPNLQVQLMKTVTSYIKTGGSSFPSTTGRTSFTFVVDTEECKYVRFKHNGAIRDIGVCIPFDYGLGTYTISFDLLGTDPSTIGSFSFKDIQIERGTTATAYEPYSSDNTFYGGYIDPAAGEIVATYAYHTLNGTEAGWSIDGSGSTRRVYIDTAQWKLIAKANGKLYCSYCRTDSSSKWYGWISSTGNSASCHILFYIPKDYDTVDKWKAYLAEHPLDICYELYSPIHYPMSKTELQTFISQNNIWSNTNSNTKVSYAIHDTAPIRAAKHRIAANEPHTEKVENKLANFSTDMQAPLKECKVYFTPKQDLHGCNSVWIGGHGKNLFNINAIEQDPSDTSVSNTTIRVFTPGTYTTCASWSNWRDPSRILAFSVSNNIMNVTSTTGYGIGYALTVLPETQYAISTVTTGNGAAINIAYYDIDGTYLSDAASNTNVINTVVTTPANAAIAVLVFCGTYADTGVTFSNVQFEKSSTITSYVPYENICPIEGCDNFEVYKAGKNLYSAATTEEIRATWTPSDATYIQTLYGLPSSQFFTLQTNVLEDKGENISNCRFYFHGLHSSGNFINTSNGTGVKSLTDKPSSNGKIIISHNRRGLDPAYYNTQLKDTQLEYGSTATEFEPYCGETFHIAFPLVNNLLETTSSTAGKTIDGTDGTLFNETGMATTDFIKVNQGEIYTLSFTSTEGPRTRRIFGYDLNKESVESLAHTTWATVDASSSIAATIPSGISYIRVCYLTTDTNKTLEGPQSYTVYGGYVDLKKGKLIQTHKCITLNGSENWDSYKESQQIHFHLTIPDKKIGLGKSICSHFPNVRNEYFWDNLMYAQYGDHRNLDRIYVNAPYEMPGLVTEWKAYLAEHPMQLCYELATPIEYTLTPTQLKTLRGQNNIWSNSNGNISIQYYKRGR